jgi:hypothetical protein
MRDFTEPRRLRPALIAAAVLMAALVSAALMLAGHRAATRSAEAPRVPHPVTEASPSPASPLSGPVTLVAGTKQTDGVSMGYPHTTLGAISAASAYLGALASTLDPNYAAAIGRAVGDPADASLASDLSSSVVKLRAALQLPASGPLPAPVTFLTTPQMYQLRAVDSDHALVLLLASDTFTNAQGGSAQTVGVYPMRMHWSGGDWRIAGIGGTGQDYAPLSAAPGSAAAQSKGWQALLATPAGGTP